MSVVNSEVMNRPFCRDITKVCECVCATESDVVDQKNAEPPRPRPAPPQCGFFLLTLHTTRGIIKPNECRSTGTEAKEFYRWRA